MPSSASAGTTSRAPGSNLPGQSRSPPASISIAPPPGNCTTAESPWPTARKVTVMPCRACASAARDAARVASSAQGKSAVRNARRMQRTTPAYQRTQANRPGAATTTVANGSQAKKCEATSVARARRSASHQRSRRSNGTRRVATGIAASPGRSPSALASTETRDRRWNAAARSGPVQSAAARVAQPSPSRCSGNRRQRGAPAAGKGKGRSSRIGRASRMRPAIPATDSCRARSCVAAGSRTAQAEAPTASVVSPSPRRASADATSPTEAPMPARTAGQGLPRSSTSKAAKGRATPAATSPALSRGAQGGALRRSADRGRALREAAAQAVEPAPDARAAFQDLDRFCAALDGDPARRQLGAPVAAARIELAGRDVNAPEEARAIAAVDGNAVHAQGHETLRNANHVRRDHPPFEFLRERERGRVVAGGPAQEAQRQTESERPERPPTQARQREERHPPGDRGSEKRAGKECRARDQQWPDSHAPLPQTHMCAFAYIERTRAGQATPGPRSTSSGPLTHNGASC